VSRPRPVESEKYGAPNRCVVQIGRGVAMLENLTIGGSSSSADERPVVEQAARAAINLRIERARVPPLCTGAGCDARRSGSPRQHRAEVAASAHHPAAS